MRIVLNGETGQMVDHATGIPVPDLFDRYGSPPAPADLEADRPGLRLVGAPEVRAFAEPLVVKSSSIRPKDVLRLARARVAEVRAELRRLSSLQLELAQLTALLSAAASARPPRPPMKKPKQGTSIQ